MDKPGKDLWNAIDQFVTTSGKDLVNAGVTASKVKSMKDALDWKQCDLHAEEERRKHE